MTNRNLALCFALLLFMWPLPCFPRYSWQDIQDWSKDFFKMDKEVAEKVMPTAVFLGVALAATGLFYWMNRKKTENIVDQKKTTTATVSSDGNSKEPEKPSLQQLSVYSQNNAEGGGGASCGYHTALRSMQVVNALGKNQNMDSLKDTLADSGAIQKYFGENGSWRKAIIQKRTEDAFKKELNSRLWVTFRKDLDRKDIYEKEFKTEFTTYDDFNSKIQGLYKSALGFMESWMLEQAHKKEIEKPYDVTDEALRGYISKGLLNLRNDKNQNLIEFLFRDKNIDSYFDYGQIRANLFSNDWILQLKSLWQKVSELFKNTQDANGEWLSDGEVEYIWSNHRKDIIAPDDTLPKIKCGFQTVSNFENIGKEGFDEVTPEIKQNLKPKINKKEQRFYIFALGTMRQSDNTQGTRGHWYPLVMHQDWDGRRTYYVMDSMSNTNRTNDENAWKLISIIEQKN